MEREGHAKWFKEYLQSYDCGGRYVVQHVPPRLIRVSSDTTETEVKLCLKVGGAVTGSVCNELIIPCRGDGGNHWNRPPSTLARLCVNGTIIYPPSSLHLSTLEHLVIAGIEVAGPTGRGEIVGWIFYPRLQP